FLWRARKPIYTSKWSGWCVLGTASVMMSFSYTDDRIRKILRDMFIRREQTFRGDERGSALIEAAILTPLLIPSFLPRPRRSRPSPGPVARLPFKKRWPWPHWCPVGVALCPRTRPGRPRGSRAAEQRDELAPSHLTEMHPIPHGPGAHRRVSEAGPAR